MTSYPTPPFRRTALAPGILGAIALLAGLALISNESGFFWIRFPVSILALIVSVYAWQAKQWWWLIGLLPIAVLWNPVWVIPFSGQLWVALQYVAAIVFIAAGILIKIRNADDRNRRPQNGRQQNGRQQNGRR
jgi:hypothetical protein